MNDQKEKKIENAKKIYGDIEKVLSENHPDATYVAVVGYPNKKKEIPTIFRALSGNGADMLTILTQALARDKMFAVTVTYSLVQAGYLPRTPGLLNMITELMDESKPKN